jgi:hypothetical protein
VTTALIGIRDGKPLSFPCKRDDLPIFLATAEEFRIRGESCRLPHAPATVVIPGTSVLMPADIGLPPVMFELP